MRSTQEGIREKETFAPVDEKDKKEKFRWLKLVLEFQSPKGAVSKDQELSLDELEF